MKKISVSISVLALILLIFCGCTTSTGEGGSANTNASSSKKSSGTIHLTRSEFISKVIDYTKVPNDLKYLGDKPCIIDFYADWCGPCKVAAPIMEELAKEYEGKIYIYKIDTQVEQQLAMELGIQSIPTFLFFALEGKPFLSSGIGKTREETKKMFKDIIDKELLKIKS